MSEAPWEPAVASAAVSKYREDVVAWLWRRHQKWKETARTATGAASDAASFYAAAYMAAADGILAGEPEQRAALDAVRREETGP